MQRQYNLQDHVQLEYQYNLIYTDTIFNNHQISLPFIYGWRDYSGKIYYRCDFFSMLSITMKEEEK